jgi:hypothetical protein
MSMLQSVMDGNGTMAQFNHPEFGGAGQWMQGGSQPAPVADPDRVLRKNRRLVKTWLAEIAPQLA